MDRAEVRAKAKALVEEAVTAWLINVDKSGPYAIAEAALTAAYDVGDKAGYVRGWNEGAEAALAEVGHGLSAEAIRRLRKKKGE